MSQHPASDWRHLAEQASSETDPQRLMDLVEQLNEVLEDREKAFFRRQIRSGQQSCLSASA